MLNNKVPYFVYVKVCEVTAVLINEETHQRPGGERKLKYLARIGSISVQGRIRVHTVCACLHLWETTSLRRRLTTFTKTTNSLSAGERKSHSEKSSMEWFYTGPWMNVINI